MFENEKNELNAFNYKLMPLVLGKDWKMNFKNKTGYTLSELGL